MLVDAVVQPQASGEVSTHWTWAWTAATRPTQRVDALRRNPAPASPDNNDASVRASVLKVARSAGRWEPNPW